MEKKATGLIALALIAGLVLGFGGGYLTYMPQIAVLDSGLRAMTNQKDALEQQYQTLRTEYETLSNQRKDLQVEYAQLSQKYIKLGEEHTALAANYQGLVGDYTDLNNDYTVAMNHLMTLSGKVSSLEELMSTYASLPDGYTRTLSEAEILKLGETVRLLTVGSQDPFYNIGRIYDYIITNVKYAYDPEYPAISGLTYSSYKGSNIIVDFHSTVQENNVQSPQFTLDVKQGDCEDQAILEYAMNYYYMKYLHGTVYKMYMAQISFVDGSGHVAIFMPYEGGKVCILDPAGHFISRKYNIVDFNPANTEIPAYGSYWVNAGHTVDRIKLYSVDPVTSSYSLVSEGSLAQVTAFLATP